MRVFVAVAIAAALVAGTLAPSGAEDAGQARALALIDTPCLVGESGDTASPAPAASSPSPGPSPAGSPSPTPTLPPLPLIQSAPGTLIPPPLPAGTPQVTPPPLPTPSPTPSASSGPIYLVPATPLPSPTATARPTAGPIRGTAPTATPIPVPSPGETLGPDDYAILGDRLTGNRGPGQPFDLDGHVNVFYQDGVLVGDHAHYDGFHYIDITGHPYLRNREGNTTLAADSIRFDTLTQHATLINGRGVTTEGVDRGRLHFDARELVTDRNGVTHGTHASLTTCENPHGGYHLEAKTLEIIPGDKAIARSVVLFLGPLAIFYLPLLVIPLRHERGLSRRRSAFVPQIGYSAAEGYYVKARIGFGTTDTYYGYYRVEGYTKIGYGLGYVATIRRKDGKRETDINIFRLYTDTTKSQNWNVSLNDQENFSRVLRSTEAFSYQSDYGPLITNLPPDSSLNVGLTKTTPKDSENFSFARQSTGPQLQTENYGVSDSHTFNTHLSNAFTSTFTTNSSNYSGLPTTNTNLHYNDDMHLSERTYDYDLILDKYDASTPTGVGKEPELLIRPHASLFPGLKLFPTTATYTIGEYSDPIANLVTSRAQAQLNFGPALAHTPLGDLNASLNVIQDAYGTGDMKAQVQQQIGLTTPLGQHFSNTLSYSNQHINGLGNEPFSWDTIGGANKNLQEIFKVFNSDVYALTLQTGTGFNRSAQPVSYQFLMRPTPLTAVVLGGAWTPGSGLGFDRTNVQIVTPLGHGSDLQFSTFVDWKNKGRLESKQIYFQQIIGNCYQINVSYNQDLKTVNLTLDILAFPSQAVNFGISNQATSIIPQSFATGQFFGG